MSRHQRRVEPSARRRGVVLSVGGLVAVVLAGCAPAPEASLTASRPDCVTLGTYSSVIHQVTDLRPDWGPSTPIAGGSLSHWTLPDGEGTHRLTAALDPDGCVCAVAATSEFRGGFAQGQLGGYLQGAAVAAVSDLEYTGRWLEPRVLVACPLAFLFRSTYRAETLMADGTTWRLSCSGHRAEEGGRFTTSLEILSPGCVAPDG